MDKGARDVIGGSEGISLNSGILFVEVTGTTVAKRSFDDE